MVTSDLSSQVVVQAPSRFSTATQYHIRDPAHKAGYRLGTGLRRTRVVHGACRRMSPRSMLEWSTADGAAAEIASHAKRPPGQPATPLALKWLRQRPSSRTPWEAALAAPPEGGAPHCSRPRSRRSPARRRCTAEACRRPRRLRRARTARRSPSRLGGCWPDASRRRSTRRGRARAWLGLGLG